MISLYHLVTWFVGNNIITNNLYLVQTKIIFTVRNNEIGHNTIISNTIE